MKNKKTWQSKDSGKCNHSTQIISNKVLSVPKNVATHIESYCWNCKADTSGSMVVLQTNK